VNPSHPPKPTHPTPLLITGGAAPDRGAWPALAMGGQGSRACGLGPVKGGSPPAVPDGLRNSKGTVDGGFRRPTVNGRRNSKTGGTAEVGALGGLGRARRARATSKQQNEPKTKTKTQNHKRGRKQEPANPRPKETKTNQ